MSHIHTAQYFTTVCHGIIARSRNIITSHRRGCVITCYWQGLSYFSISTIENHTTVCHRIIAWSCNVITSPRRGCVITCYWQGPSYFSSDFYRSYNNFFSHSKKCCICVVNSCKNYCKEDSCHNRKRSIVVRLRILF